MSEQRVVWKAVLLGLGAWLIHCLAALVVVAVLVACVPRHTDLFDVLTACSHCLPCFHCSSRMIAWFRGHSASRRCQIGGRRS